MKRQRRLLCSHERRLCLYYSAPLRRVPKVAAPVFFYRGRGLGYVENARNPPRIPCAFLLAIPLPLGKIRALRLSGHALAAGAKGSTRTAKGPPAVWELSLIHI